MNSNQLTTNEEALRLFFNEDVYLVPEKTPDVRTTPLKENDLEQPTQSVSNISPTLATPAQPEASVKEPAPVYQPIEIKHLGKNEKGILILVNDGNNAVSTVQGVELLRKLLLSIHLKNADFALVNYAHYSSLSFNDLQNFFSSKLILSFGVPTTALKLPAQSLHEVREMGGIKTIFTHNLDDLETDLASKKMLWATLKNLKI